MPTFTNLLMQQARLKAQLAGRPSASKRETADIVYAGALSASERAARAAETKRLEEAAVTQKEQFGETLSLETEKLVEQKRAEEERLGLETYQTAAEIEAAKKAVKREKLSSGIQVGATAGYVLGGPWGAIWGGVVGGAASGGSK